MKGKRAVTIVLVSLLVCFLAATQVLASNFGSLTDGPWVANNGHHHVDFRNVDTQRYDMTIWSIDNNYQPLDPVVHVVDDTDYDVRVLDNDYGNSGWTARVDCPSSATLGGTHPNKWCFGLLLQYNLDETEYPHHYDTAAERRSLACEEFGHSFGLQHSSNSDSCMGRPVENSTTLVPHDKDKINDYYNPSDGPA